MTEDILLSVGLISIIILFIVLNALIVMFVWNFVLFFMPNINFIHAMFITVAWIIYKEYESRV